MSAIVDRESTSGKRPLVPYSTGAVAKLGRSPLLLAVVFLGATWLAASVLVADTPMGGLVIAAAVIGAYVAMNIGANDVANNVAAAVGSRALSLTAAMAMAAVFEVAGAMIAGGDVVSTISKGIINPALVPNAHVFVLAMGSALAAAGLWLNLATWSGAPVSTTHSIVGAVLGAGIAAAGFGVVDWTVMSGIAASWFISPVLGGIIAAAFLAAINKTIFARDDMVAASRVWVPVFVGIMAGSFAMYLTMKGLSKLWKPDFITVLMIGGGGFVLFAAGVRPLIARASTRIDNRRGDINTLFNIPLICSAALLCFAHGANDVANAIGPLSAIVDAAGSGQIADKAAIPLWIMALGALGIAVGLGLFGAELVRKVGSQLTALDQTRAFCAALSAAITVIAASAMGLPVSSTHIAIGAIFGIGFYREFKCNSRIRMTRREMRAQIRPKGLLAARPVPRTRPRKLVRRNEVLTIAAAWLITVPASAVLAGFMFVLATLVFPSA